MAERNKPSLPPTEQFLPDKEAADFLGIEIRDLKALRYRGDGPVYCRISRKRCVYRKAALLAFLDARSFSSTKQEAVTRRDELADIAA